MEAGLLAFVNFYLMVPSLLMNAERIPFPDFAF